MLHFQGRFLSYTNVGMDPNFEIAWFSLLGYNGHEHPLDNGTQFMETIHGFVNLFPTFANDLLFNRTHLLTSRFYLKFARIYYNSYDGHLINQIRALTKQSNLPIIGRTPRVTISRA